VTWETDPGLTYSWTFVHRKYGARMTGSLNRPNVHNARVPRVGHCSACGQIFFGRWAYDEPT